MYSPEAKLNPPEDYSFPYKPYAIQVDLMTALYTVLEEKQIGIFESPTGTGKSLTLTCAALRWLEDHQRLVREELQQKINLKESELKLQEAVNSKADDWINAQYETNQQRTELKQLRDLKAWIDEYDTGLCNIKERQVIRKEEVRLRKLTKEKKDIAEKDETILETQLKDVLEENSINAEDIDEKQKCYRDVQIFFCSRTHSQLAQVVREVKSTAYGKRVRCITLGSRQQLCVNPKVRNLKNKALINERCLDLTQKTAKLLKSGDNDDKKQKKDASKTCACPFKTQNLVQQLAEIALVDILDIEELGKEGHEQKACAYYAARNAAVSAAQLVMLPYQTLLHHRTRKRSGIDLRGSIIIIDEAHNLLDTIADLHSCELTLQHLCQAKNAIQAYKNRYVKLLNAANLLNINQLLYVIRRLTQILDHKDTLEDLVSKSRIVRTYQLTDDGEFFNIDLFKLLEFCERTRFIQKLHGFTQEMNETEPLKENTPPKKKENATTELLKRLQSEETESNKTKNRKSALNKQTDEAAQQTLTTANENSENKVEKIGNISMAPLYALIEFLEALTEKAEDGRVLIKVDGTTHGSLLRYIVLNPSNHFQDVVKQARAIIIAGGTMQPTDELTEQLFHKCPERVRLNFYDHVVSEDAVLPFVVQQGPTGKRLCFNFNQRGNAEMLLELSMILQNLCQVIPAGVVCFLPSYDYLDKVYEHLRTTNILTRIADKKRVFRETRTVQQNGQSVEQLLQDYDGTIKQKGGALLLSVVGGKLSEGLNFKDNLARGVIVVGMPYANSQSLELQERMNFLNTTLGAGTGRQYYENLCMKAVNQCIGRAVRHINDYAAVYLLDERYSQENIRKKLPQWISRSLQMPRTFGLVQATTAKYFKQKQKEKPSSF